MMAKLYDIDVYLVHNIYIYIFIYLFISLYIYIYLDIFRDIQKYIPTGCVLLVSTRTFYIRAKLAELFHPTAFTLVFGMMEYLCCMFKCWYRINDSREFIDSGQT